MGSQKKIVKNALFLYALTFSNYFIGLLLFPYLSRVLSVEVFGIIGYATSLCMIFQMIIEYGFQISTTATIALNRDNKEKISKVVSTMTCSKAVLAVISLAAFVLCCSLSESLREHGVALALFYCDAAIKAFLPDSYFRGIEKMGQIATRAVAVKSGILVLTALFVKGDDTFLIYPLSMILCDVVALVWAFLLIRRDRVEVYRVPIADALREIKSGFWFFVSRISVSINGSLGSLFLGFRYSPESVEMGLYSGATRLSTAAEQMISPIGDALYPSMMKSRDYRLFYKTVLLGGSAWVAGCVSAALLANPLCELILGPQYVVAGDYLRVLLVGVAFGFFSNLFGYPALSPIGKAKQANVAIMLSTCVSLAAFVLLWATGNITVQNVCVAASMMNAISFSYRFYTFCRYRPRCKLELRED